MNVTETMQRAPGAIAPVQVFPTTVKSPVTVGAAMGMEADVMFVRLMSMEEDVAPTSILPKSTVVAVACRSVMPMPVKSPVALP